MKIFISQPMNDKTDDEILSIRKYAIDKCYEKYGNDVTFLNSFFQGISNDHPLLWWLAKSLELLSDADLAVFIGDWEQYRGCKIEHICAKEYNIPIIYL